MSDQAPSQRGSFWFFVILAALVLLLAFLLHMRTRQVPLLLDDLTAVALLFPDGAFDGASVLKVLWPSDPQYGFNDHFRPVGWASAALDLWLFGPDAEALRATACLIHALCAFLVGCIVRVLFGPGWTAGALVASGYFMLHPGAAEPVVWISHRFTILAVLWFLLALLALIRLVRCGHGRIWLAAFSALALLTKDSMLSEIWALVPVAYFLAPPASRAQQCLRAGLTIGASWTCVLLLRVLATGRVLPSFEGGESGGDVVQTFDPLARLMDLPHGLRLLAVPINPEMAMDWVWFTLMAGATAFILFLALRRQGASALLLLLVGVVGAGLPVFSFGDGFDGSRRLYLPAAALSILLASGMQRRTLLAGILLVAAMVPSLLSVQDTWLSAGVEVEGVVRDIERVAEGAPRVRVGGLPASRDGVPLFGTGLEHLAVRFRPPMRQTLLPVLGIPEAEWPRLLDTAQGGTRLLRFREATAAGSRLEYALDLPGVPLKPENAVVKVLVPRNGSRWTGDALLVSMPVIGDQSPRSWLVTVQCSDVTFQVIVPALLPEVTATSWRLPLAMDHPVFWAPRDRDVLLRVLEGDTVSALLRVQSLGPPGTQGFHSKEILIKLGRSP